MDEQQATGCLQSIQSLSSFVHEAWILNRPTGWTAGDDEDDDTEFVWSTFVTWCTKLTCMTKTEALQRQLAELHRFLEPAAVALLPLVAKHGHFKSLQKVWEHTIIALANSEAANSEAATSAAATSEAATSAATSAALLKRLADAVVDVVVGFLKADQKVLADAAAASSPVDSTKLSLAGRYVPRTTRRVQKIQQNRSAAA